MLDTISLSINSGIYLNVRPRSQSQSEANLRTIIPVTVLLIWT